MLKLKCKTGVNPSNRVGFEPSIRYSDNSIQHLGAWLRITDGMNFKGIISTTIWIKDIGILKQNRMQYIFNVAETM